MINVDTPHGLARVESHPAHESRGLLVLGHGAGGGIGARDLLAARDAALAWGVSVALVEQPYRVAGRRSPAPAAQLDAAWLAVIAALEERPLIVGGRSSGARVACRTAAQAGAVGVLCLAFPLHPPGKPEKSRLAELDAVDVPVLVVQGSSDPFGMPPARPGREVVVVRGNHSLGSDVLGLAAAVGEWLPLVLKPGRRRRRSRAPAR
jgi:predicted alpha/beta-hydrolase family hydrolase